jgi:small subunit ribosomal protein S10
MKKQRIKLKFKSYDHRLLDKTVKQVALAAKRTGAQLVGPTPLPNEQWKGTVLRSPHVNKKAREQFELTTHKRIMAIVSPSEKTMDALMKLNISGGVEFEIKVSGRAEAEIK